METDTREELLESYRRYIEDNLERIERGEFTPICFVEFCQSEEHITYRG